MKGLLVRNLIFIIYGTACEPYHHYYQSTTCVNVGDIVYNVVNSLHMDAKYYPDPLKFDPDRFSEERKHEILPNTFMPFGNGPRNCIASRFAILEAKVLMYHIILNFELLNTKKTLDPIKLGASDFSIKVNGGSYVKCRARN